MKKAGKVVLDFLKRYTALFIVAGFYIALAVFGFGCPIRALTGIPCPGCGMSRAWLAVLRLDFRAAFYYHPLFWTVPAAVIVFIFRKKLLPGKIMQTVALSALLAAFMIVYILRLLVLKDSAIYILK